jgi:hypothetical protein
MIYKNATAAPQAHVKGAYRPGDRGLPRSAGDNCSATAHSAAEELTRIGTRVRLDRSSHVPEDEGCFFVLEAPSGREAALVPERAALEPIRVVDAVWSGKESK